MVRAPPRVLPRSLAPSGVLGEGGLVPVPPYLAWGCGGGGRASPGGVPSTVARDVWGQAIPLPRLPAHWAGCRGPRSTCCGRGCAGVGALLCPLGLHALRGLPPAGRVRGVRVPGGGLGGGGGGVRRTPRLCGWGGPVGRGVALPLSTPLPSPGRQQSGCHWRCAVHGGRVLSRLLWVRSVPRPGASARARLFFAAPVGAGGWGWGAGRAPAPLSGGWGTIPPASGGGGQGPRGLRAGGGEGGGWSRGVASLLPFWLAACGTQSWPPSCRRRAPFRRARAVGVEVPPRGGRG